MSEGQPCISPVRLHEVFLLWYFHPDLSWSPQSLSYCRSHLFGNPLLSVPLPSPHSHCPRPNWHFRLNSLQCASKAGHNPPAPQTSLSILPSRHCSTPLSFPVRTATLSESGHLFPLLQSPDLTLSWVSLQYNRKRLAIRRKTGCLSVHGRSVLTAKTHRFECSCPHPEKLPVQRFWEYHGIHQNNNIFRRTYQPAVSAARCPNCSLLLRSTG